ncbi:DUF1187 family protein [Citrobacter werkmanii]|uniref:DUF1187 family protein n=1 Tax=Citrobacter werkmanii TaxID=67827 RepID=UPI003AB67016
MTLYKITATIHKPGNTPVDWLRFSDKKLNKTECEKIMSVSKEAGVTNEVKVTLKNYKCVKAVS